MAYLLNPFTLDYIANIAIGSGARQADVDHAWNNILRGYFRPLAYSVERESYLAPDRQFCANVAVINRRNGLHHKAIVVEAKRPTDITPTEHDWDVVRRQLQRNMLLARISDGNIQTMYGIAAIGPLVRMYGMSMIRNDRGRLEPAFTNPPRSELHLVHDALQIEPILKTMENLIWNTWNIY